MIEHGQLRLLAPVGLVVFALAFVLVIVTSGGGSPPYTGPTATSPRSAPPAPPARPPRRNYVVKSGDNLTAISDKTDVPVERLRELNPDLDPQALRVGQRVKLRQ